MSDPVEPVYTFRYDPRCCTHPDDLGRECGGCGTEFIAGEIVARQLDEFRCKTCAERWN